MYGRVVACALLLITAIGCGQSSTPNAAAPSSNCTFGLSTGATINGYPNGGSFTMGVTASAASGCNWTASSQASWIHVPDGESGTSSGAFTFTVDPNPGAARSGTLTVAGLIVVFNQTAAAVTVGTPTPACTYALSIGSTINGYPTGGTFASAVTTTPSTGCDWTAVSNATWIHITSGTSGSGNGSFTFAVDSNPGPARAGTLTAANEIVVFNQSSASGQ